VPLFRLKDKYVVGVRTMDAERATLLGLMNEFHAATMEGEGQSAVGPLLLRLVTYSRDRSFAGEALMKSLRYPGLAEHQASHRDGRRQIGEHMVRHQQGDRTVAVATLNAMYVWINEHILIEDVKFSQWLKEQGSGESTSAQSPGKRDTPAFARRSPHKPVHDKGKREALFTWSKKYSVGVKAMDEQHTQLMGLTNEFHAAVMTGQPHSAAGPLLRKVLAYVRGHFSAEEALMKAYKFPGLADHQAIHKDLTRQAGEYMARYEKGDQTVYVPLLKALRDAVTGHILVEDMKYVPWMNEHGVR